MATKYSDLELAINSLVTEFHKATENNGASLNTTQFQTMMSDQLPAVAKTMDSEETLGEALKLMGVDGGQDISFENFWTLVNHQAVQMFKNTHKEKDVKCTCSLQ